MLPSVDKESISIDMKKLLAAHFPFQKASPCHGPPSKTGHSDPACRPLLPCSRPVERGGLDLNLSNCLLLTFSLFVCVSARVRRSVNHEVQGCGSKLRKVKDQNGNLSPDKGHISNKETWAVRCKITGDFLRQASRKDTFIRYLNIIEKRPNIWVLKHHHMTATDWNKTFQNRLCWPWKN